MLTNRFDPYGRASLTVAAFLFGAAALLGVSVTARGQGQGEVSTAPAAAAGEGTKTATLWEDFIHGIKVAREELVKSNGEAILSQPSAARELYLLSVRTPDVEAVLARGEKLQDMAAVIAGVRQLIEQGYQAERSDPAQIANSIDMLPKSLRAYEIAASRLERSGEYAMPQLISRLSAPQTSASLVERIVAVLPRLGKEAVGPLCEALQSPDPRVVEIVANALGQIRYPDAAPYLKSLIERPGILDRTRQVATAALMACADKGAMDKPTASLFYEEAEKYYYQRASVAPDPHQPTANVWYWHEGLGLDFKTVRREIFCDIYAMRLAAAALRHDGRFHPAVSLWLAAKLKKEVDLPPGSSDPTEEAGGPTARFYALAGSAKYLQDVLQRALTDGNGELAIRAIEALSRTAGAASLVEPVSGGATPLVVALSNSDRQVRFLAALAMASALPQKRFAGDEMVITVLNEALRASAGKRAVVIAADQAQRNLLKDTARNAGYEVIDGPDTGKVLAAVRETQGADLVLLGKAPPAPDTLRAVRADASLTTVPVLVASASPELKALAKSDGRVTITEESASAGTVSAAMAEAVKSAGVALVAAGESATWTIRAAEAVRLLGMTSNPVLDISRTAGPLAALLGDKNTEVSMAAARALAAISGARAQQALVAAAMDGKSQERIRIDILGLLSGSLRRFGNQLTDSQSQSIVELVVDTKQPQPLRDAAAEAMGAMNLPSEKIKSLILESLQTL